jgi:hypothetical protein
MPRSVRLIFASVLAAGAIAVFTPTSATAMAPCQGRSLFSTLEYRQTVAVTGVYTVAGATDVQLTCGLVRNGVTVARVSENAPGPVAVVAGAPSISNGSFSVCHEAYVTYLDKAPYTTDTCP